jgi:hypothetical protein
MLELVHTQVEDSTTIKRYSCDFIVETAGDGLWGCEAGRKINVRGVTVIDEQYDEDEHYVLVNVEHDSTWDIYTDSGFESAISDAVGFAVTFTEQGMQDDNMASMEPALAD